MLVYNSELNKYVVDPHFLTIIPFKKVSAQECGDEKLIWIYHMYNPHSPFRDYKNSLKCSSIIQSVFPKSFIDKQEQNLKLFIEEANRKNKELDEMSDLAVNENNEVIDNPEKIKKHFVPRGTSYEPDTDDDVKIAAEWYKEHLKQTPLWFAYESYKEAIYNLSTIIRSPLKTAAEIKTASVELDNLPIKMEKMRLQAEKDEANTLKVSGDRNIKRSEKMQYHRSQHQK
jgi:hypothetical protein